MSNFWDKQELIEIIPKNKSEEIRVSHCERQGKEYVDIRIYKDTSTSTEKISTKSGVVIPLKQFIEDMPKILEKLNK